MKLCAMCRRLPRFSPHNSFCLGCHAAYQRQLRGPRPIRPSDKALAWLRAAPRTSAQIAELLGVAPNDASALLYRLRKRGLVRAVGALKRGNARPQYTVA